MGIYQDIIGVRGRYARGATQESAQPPQEKDAAEAPQPEASQPPEGGASDASAHWEGALPPVKLKQVASKPLAASAPPPPAGRGALRTTAAQQARLNNGGHTWRELTEALNPYRPDSEEEAAARERREKRDMTLSAVGDLFNAFGNLYAATNGAPAVQTQPQAPKMRERLDALRREREARDRQYYIDISNAEAQDRADVAAERLRRQQEEDRAVSRARMERQDALAEARDRRAEEKEERQAALDNARLALAAQKLTYQGYMNYIAEVKAGRFAELTDAQIARLNRSGTGKTAEKPAEHPWYDSDGNLHYAHSSSAALENARLHGTAETPTETSTSTRTSQDALGRDQTTTTTTTRSGKPHAAAPKHGKPDKSDPSDKSDKSDKPDKSGKPDKKNPQTPPLFNPKARKKAGRPKMRL